MHPRGSQVDYSGDHRAFEIDAVMQPSCVCACVLVRLGKGQTLSRRSFLVERVQNWREHALVLRYGIFASFECRLLGWSLQMAAGFEGLDASVFSVDFEAQSLGKRYFSRNVPKR